MKKVLFLMFGVCLMAACSSSEDEFVPQPTPQPVEENLVEMTISSNPTGVRTILRPEQGNAIDFQKADKLSLFDGYGNREFKNNMETETASSTTFSGMVDAQANEFYALYPYQADATFNKEAKTITATVPTEQIAYTSSYDALANLSVAKIKGDRSFELLNIGTLIKITIPDGVRFDRCLIMADEGGVAGKVTIDAETGAVVNKQKQLDPSYTAGDRLLLKTATGDWFKAGKTYYAVILPGEYTNFVVRLYRQDVFGEADGYITSPKTITFTQGKIKNMGDDYKCTFPGFGFVDGHEWVDFGLTTKNEKGEDCHLYFATCNVGADWVYQSGNYYSFGGLTPQTSYNEANLQYKTAVAGRKDLPLDRDVVRQEWGEKWRMMTSDECVKLLNLTWVMGHPTFGDYKVTTFEQPIPYKVRCTHRGDYSDGSNVLGLDVRNEQDPDIFWFMPLCGSKVNNDWEGKYGTVGGFWTSTSHADLDTNGNHLAYRLVWTYNGEQDGELIKNDPSKDLRFQGHPMVQGTYRYVGLPVRGVYVVPLKDDNIDTYDNQAFTDEDGQW